MPPRYMHEQEVSVQCGNTIVPCSRYEATEPVGVVLFGHGLGVDRRDETVRLPAELLNDFGFTVIVPELPLHGERSEGDSEWEDITSSWQEFWAGDGRNSLLAEWQQVLAYVQRSIRLPVFYFGLSLGTQYGVLFLSQTKGLNAAVLGLFGSEPPPKSRVMNLLAPTVTVPVYFIQKLDDEIHPAENTSRLYNSLGTSEKVLDATPGLHGEVSRHSIEGACRFLSQLVDA